MADYSGKDFDHYHIIEKLGQGGMASVFRAYDTRLERDVALKVVRKETIPPEQLERIMQRFVREAKALAKFIHPNIVPIHDFGEVDGAPYLVMAYLPGGTLQSLVDAPMPTPQAVRWLAPIADALAYAHRRGVIHRDVKPSNILITEEGVPMLSDFGIARLIEENATQLTGTGLGVGTPAYMAPEQWQGKPGEATDQYALGVVLFELLTGQKPYTAETPLAIALKQMNDPLPRPSAINPHISGAAEKVLFKALAKDPADRYADMSAFEKALDGLQTQQSEKHSAPVLQEATPAERPEASAASQPAPTPMSEGETVDELDASGSVQEKELTSGSGKKVAWIWLVGAVAVIGILLAALFWPKDPDEPIEVATGMTDTPTAQQTAVVLTETLPAAEIPTATSTDEPTRTSTTAATATEALGIGSTRVNEVDGAEMVYVPAGEFWMGDNFTMPDENPAHTVFLDAYWIYKYEVTNEQFVLFLNDLGNQKEGGVNWLNSAGYEVKIVQESSKWVVDEGYGNYPVVYVTWYGAQAFCEWAGGGLPTEAEWEKAARGTEGRTFPWGESDPSCSLAPFGDCDGGIMPVGSFPNGASPYGALDMAGNVWEWVADWYERDYYDQLIYDNPTGPKSGESRVIRGGSWYSYVWVLRSSFRDRDDPDFTYNYSGFRCRLSSEP